MAMQSAITAAKTITAATNAAPGVFTSSAHGLVDGDRVLLEVLGMSEVDGRMFTVFGSATNTFELENPAGTAGIDTTTFGVFTSGTAKRVTMGITMSGVQEFSPQGGDIKFLATTTVHDKKDKQTVVGANAMSYSLTMQWDPADAGQAAMIAAFEGGDNKAFKITWPNGRHMMFYGTVGYSGMPGGSSQGVTTSPAAIAMNGAPTYGMD
jgi:hypothetical protein